MANLGRFLTLKVRQSLGLVLPGVLVFSLGQDLARQQWPALGRRRLGPAGRDGRRWACWSWSCRPLFVRLAWPTRPLAPRPAPRPARAPGAAVRVPLHRHPGLGHRARPGQRRRDGGLALVPLRPADRRPDREPEPARGRGGLRPRDRPHRPPAPVLFRVLLRGEPGRAGAAGAGCSTRTWLAGSSPWLPAGWARPTVDVDRRRRRWSCSAWGSTSWLVFGHLSRRFERQADVFGCRAVSCGQADCPPHADPDSPPSADPGRRRRSARWASGSSPTPWPTSPRSTAWSTRPAPGGTAASAGGSPSSRASKAGPRPSGGSRPGSRRLRLVVALVLIAALALAVANGAIEQLR